MNTKNLNNISLGLKKLISITSVLIISLFITACDELETKKTVDTAGVIDRAEAYLNQGQYRAASIEAKNALQQDPNNNKAHLILSKLALEIGQPKLAIKQLEEKPQSTTEYLLLLSEAYIKTGKFFSAHKILTENADKLTNDAPLKHGLLLATSQYSINENQEASQTLKQLEQMTNLSNTQKSELYLKFASFYQSQKNLEKAGEYLDRSLEAEATPQALLQKGAIAFKANKLEDAEDHLSNALISLKNTDIITPLRINILKGLIQTLSKSGRSSEALIYSKLLSEATPNAEENRNKFEEAIKLYKDGELDKAEQLLSELYSANRNEFSGRMLGLIKAMKGELTEADALLSEHIDPETASSKAIGVLAETKLKLRQNQEALTLLSEKVKITPNDPNILSIYGIALVSSGQIEKGIEAIKKALKITPSNSNLKVTLADIYTKQGNNKEALALLKQAHEEQPESQKTTLAYIKALLSDKNIKSAKQISDSLLSKQPDSSFALRVAGVVNLASDNVAEGIKLLEKSATANPQSLATLFNLGQAYIKNNEPLKAIDVFDKTMSLAPSNPATYKAYISANELNNSSESAINHLKQLAENDITLWTPQTVLAEYYLRNLQFNEGAKQIESALQRNAIEGYPQAIALNLYIQIAKKALNENDFQTARTELMKGLQIKPDNIQFLALLATTEIKSDQLREAQKLIDQINTDYPESGAADELLGDIALKSNQFEDALSKYMAAWSKRPNDSTGTKIYHLSKKLNKETSAHLESWMQKIPGSYKPLLFKAMSQHASGDTGTAKALYQKVLKINPNTLEALNNLAWIKFEDKDDGAESIAKRGTDLFPNNAAMLDTYGWILLNNGKKSEAQKILKKAHENAPDNKEIEDHYLESLK